MAGCAVFATRELDAPDRVPDRACRYPERFPGLLRRSQGIAEMSAQTDDVTALSVLIRGFQVSRMIRLAADLGLADHLVINGEAGGMAAVALASVTGVSAEPLLRMCRALAAFGVFTVDADGKIGHSPMSLLLRRDSRPGLYHEA